MSDRKRGRPPGTFNRDDRYHAHDDEERDRARVRLRLARDRFEKAELVWWSAVDERQKAADHAFLMGMQATEIAEVYAIPHQHVYRMLARVRGEDTYAARRLKRSGERQQTNRRKGQQ